uniref:G-protein coupled receptors family 1 profile domain-containing protein n=1 Tax=Nannospalax galili TaxID=1026970 RepID=A0A8C6RKM1_NANGA
NQTSVTDFLLLGVTDTWELNPLLFAVFLTIYLVNVAGNGAILMVVISDPRLHSPMYFFLGNLACLDICYSTVTVPKMLENLLSTNNKISFLGCITQLHFFHFLGSTEALLLAVMAFDRWWLSTIGFFHTFLHSPLLDLACGNTELNLWLLSNVTGTIAIGLFFLTFLSYFYIITYLFLKTRYCSMLRKALSTCASHFMVVTIFYAPVLFIYICPSSGSSLDQDSIIAIMCTVVTPALNPLIYTLKNKGVRGALTRKTRWWLWVEEISKHF